MDAAENDRFVQALVNKMCSFIISKNKSVYTNKANILNNNNVVDVPTNSWLILLLPLAYQSFWIVNTI